MKMGAESTSTFCHVQRASSRMRLGACIALSSDDLAFVDSSIETLEIRKKQIDGGLILEIRGVNHDSGNR